MVTAVAFIAIMAELNTYDRAHMACNMDNIFYLTLYRKSLLRYFSLS